MSESDSNLGSQLPSSYDSEIQQACPALLASGGSEWTVATPATSSSSDPPSSSPGRVTSVALRGASPTASATGNRDPLAAPDAVRARGSADSQLNRLLEDQERAARGSPARERSPHREATRTYAIGTPTSSRAATPTRRSSPRANPVTPRSQDDQMSELLGELFELKQEAADD